MAYDESLADRVRKILGRRRGVTEKKMFGGLAFLFHEKMFCGILGTDLVARLGEESANEMLEDKNVRPMDFTGRPMRGYLYVSPRGTKSDVDLRSWVNQCMRFVSSLPEAKAKKVNRKTK